MDIPDESFQARAEKMTDIFFATPLNLGQSNNTFKCSVCSYTTYRKFNMERHEQRHKKKPVDTSTPNKKEEPLCTSTPNKTSNKVTLPKSDRLSHSAEIICEQCAKPLRSRFGLSLHMKGKHDFEFKYNCSVCNKGYNQQKAYKFHCANHLKFILQTCKYCSKSLHGHASLKRHEAICPLNENKLKSDYSCDECFQLFNSKDSLNYHKKGKHGPKKYLGVGKRYSWRSSLNSHKNLCK